MQVLAALDRELKRGGQCYCVVPRIADMEGVAAMVAKLTPEARIISAHGQMVPEPQTFNPKP